MSRAYIRTRDDDDPYYVSPEEEKQMEADAEVERLHTEVARQESIIADLQEALSEAINYLAVWAVSNKNYGASALLDKCTAALANGSSPADRVAEVPFPGFAAPRRVVVSPPGSADQARVIADLDEALTKIAEIAGDYGDGAPDSHYLAVLMLQLESIATSALDEARGTHRKALEAMQKRQQP